MPASLATPDVRASRGGGRPEPTPVTGHTPRQPPLQHHLQLHSAAATGGGLRGAGHLKPGGLAPLVVAPLHLYVNGVSRAGMGAGGTGRRAPPLRGSISQLPQQVRLIQ